jgi:hypothetical protein
VLRRQLEVFTAMIVQAMLVVSKCGRVVAAGLDILSGRSIGLVRLDCGASIVSRLRARVVANC